MTLTWLGRAALYVSFVGTLGGATTQLVALRRGRRSHALWWAALALAGMAGAVAVMQFALITHNFALAYVAQNNATFTPLLYSITGMWSALEGSLLLWALRSPSAFSTTTDERPPTRWSLGRRRCCSSWGRSSPS